MRGIVLSAIKLYQVGISPYLLGRCRFTPSCSQYAYEATERWGVLKGTWLALHRLSRCRPFGGQGYDPVP